MKHMDAALVLLALFASPQLKAAVDKTLCPQILNRPSLGLADDHRNIAELFNVWDATHGWQIKRELTDSYVSIAPSGVRNFKIKVTEEQAQPSQAVQVLEIDCPLPVAWQAMEQPKVKVAFPTRVADAATVNSFQETHTVKGFSFSTLTGARQSLTIHPLWRILEVNPQSTLDLPHHIPADKVSVTSGSLKNDHPSAVRAFRMSAQADIAQQKLWHLVLESHGAGDQECTYFAVDRATSDYFKLGLTDATKVACEVETLTYWNAGIGRVINCVNTVNFTDPNNCANVNMRSYSGILEKLRKNEAFYVQLLVKTGETFVLPTYKVDRSGVQLVEQSSVHAPADLGLPIEINW
ncbi:hypothetical protein [Oligoflexus tunisiensis]|uniref:hypothetical protein n=1 Tax=Oligoflexus tunisiensis TaxID=708132 RepID=UPI00114CAC3A|nr:hypothetical protein [Oligoflexus tunisiensis]